jgi:hypothetical protein
MGTSHCLIGSECIDVISLVCLNWRSGMNFVRDMLGEQRRAKARCRSNDKSIV